MKSWTPPNGQELSDLRLLSEYCTDVIARVGPDMSFRYVSPSAERLFRRPIAATLGHMVREFVVPEDMPIIAAATARLVAGETDSSTITVRAVRGDGSLIWVEVTSRPIGDFTLGQPGDRAVVMRDVTERKLLEQELTAMAMKDGLTGLANRRAFDEALSSAWFRTVHDDTQMSLILLDIDRFKGFNDAYGHQTGDDCLRAIAHALQSLPIEADDMVARYGGEEMAIILAHAGSSVAANIASRACFAVEALGLPHRMSAEHGGFVTVSVGVATAMACHGGSAEMPYALLAAADRALYQAKDGGRNRVATSLLLAASAR